MLPHPPDDVFAAVMSPEIAPLIDPAVRRWEPDRRPIEVGTRFAVRGRLQWVPIRGTSQVTVWQPARRAEFEAVRPRRPVAAHATHEFEVEGTGTRYTWTMTFRHRGPVGRRAARFLGPVVDRTIAEQQRTLAAWLDEHPDAAANARL